MHFNKMKHVLFILILSLMTLSSSAACTADADEPDLLLMGADNPSVYFSSPISGVVNSYMVRG